MAISSLIGRYAVKAAGAVGVGILTYDAHKRGVLHGKINKNKHDFQALDYYYENSRNLNTDSHFNSNMKDKLFKWELDNNLRGFVNKGLGYVKGFVGMVTDDVLPWALSIAAIGVKGAKKIPAPTAANPNATKTVMSMGSKVAGTALGLYTAYAFIKNICGFGVTETK